MKDLRFYGRIATGVAAAVAALALAAPADAKKCGGDTPCTCGSKVVGTATLGEDLVGCEGVGLKLASGATLDCAGHEIRGLGKEKSKYGIVLDGVESGEVRNCTVSRFERGIRVRGGKNVRIEKNVVRDNETGIETAGATKRGQVLDAVIADNLLERNELDGVHLGVGTVRPHVLRNRFVENAQESLNLCECVQCKITENVVEDSGSAGIYARNVSNAYFADNVLRRSFFYLRGDAANNVLARNEIDDGFYLFGGYTGRGFTNDPGWVKVPRDNEIIGGSVSGKKYCFRFKGASNNRVRGTVTHGCEPVSSKPYGDFEPENNRIALREAGEDFDGDGVANVADDCTDVDGDGFGDPGFRESTCERDNCPEVANADQADRDGDGFGDACDVCADVFDPAQIDRDHDGEGDSCQACADDDGDGRRAGGASCGGDNCPDVANADQADFDGDGIGDACDACPYLADAGDPSNGDPGSVCGAVIPAALDADAADVFRRGALAFTRIESPASGLGPGFNGKGCVECHSHPTVGGSSQRLVTMYGKIDAHGFDPLEDQGGPALQAEGIRTPDCSAPTEGVPLGAVARQRQATPLYGLGLIEAVSEEAILAGADPDDADGDGVSGRVNRIDGRVGRFGWKADEATLDAIVAKAMQQEMGITTPLRPEEEKRVREIECDPAADPEDDGTHLQALVEFVRALPPLPPGTVGAPEERGRALFRDAGCQSCHVAELPAADAAPDAEAIRLYSDLLLHDMGDYLGDGITAGDAGGNEFRTAPLWGVRESKPYLHDGRAETLEAAIALHAGEAQRARERFLALPDPDRKSLVAFLESL